MRYVLNSFIKVTCNGLETVCQVCEDKNHFPFIVVNGLKLRINNTEFPRTVKLLKECLEMRLEIIEGEKELDYSINNPYLYYDVLSKKQKERFI